MAKMKAAKTEKKKILQYKQIYIKLSEKLLLLQMINILILLFKINTYFKIYF